MEKYCVILRDLLGYIPTGMLPRNNACLSYIFHIKTNSPRHSRLSAGSLLLISGGGGNKEGIAKYCTICLNIFYKLRYGVFLAADMLKYSPSSELGEYCL